MKKLLLITFFAIGMTANAQWINFISGEEDRFQFTVWTDIYSAIHEKEKNNVNLMPHTGVEMTYVIGAPFISLSVSYFDLDPDYFDYVFSTGINWEMFGYEKIRYYGGGRIGVEYREKNPNPLAGLVIGMEWELVDGFAVGFRLWVDHRESQDDGKYGDSSSYEPGMIFTSPNSQENSAITFSFVW